MSKLKKNLSHFFTLCRFTLCRAFDPLSFDPMSFDPVSFDPLSVNHGRINYIINYKSSKPRKVLQVPLGYRRFQVGCV